MGKLTTFDIVLGVLYMTAAVALSVTAYSIYIKRFRRAKLHAMNKVTLVTSQYNVFKKATKFLVESPEPCAVKVELLNEKEELVECLVDVVVNNLEHPFDFDPSVYPEGKYYLYLTSDNAKILRGITISKA
ncbi:MAG: hypothetical protein ACI857_000960 [Arenicella sp.]|jgi:hypothetical protein